MEEDDTGHNQLTNPDQESKPAAEDAKLSQRIKREFYERLAEKSVFQPPDPIFTGQAFMEFGNWMVTDPDKLGEAQAELMLVALGGGKYMSKCGCVTEHVL